ncbi:hypothetical protein D3C87_2186990 [compost metagenome]
MCAGRLRSTTYLVSHRAMKVSASRVPSTARVRAAWGVLACFSLRRRLAVLSQMIAGTSKFQ